jgi:transcriptional regulator with XRE-family HTH domain
MATKKTRPRLSQKLRQLRKALKHTQASFGALIGVSQVTVAIWENTRPPGGVVLYRLANLAEEHGLDDLMGAFLNAAHADPMSTAERYGVNEDVACWMDIRETLVQVLKNGLLLKAEGNPKGEEIESQAIKLMDLCKAANERAWRNQR